MWTVMKHQLYKYSTSQLMVISFTDGLCVWSDVHDSIQPCFNQTFLVWLSLDSLHSAQWLTLSPLTVRKISVKLPHLNTGWKTSIVLYCVGLVTHSSLLHELVRKLRSTLYCFQATSELSSSCVLMVCSWIRCESLHRVEWSEICSPVNTGVKLG